MRLSSKFIDYVIPKQTKIDLEGELRHKVDKLVIEIKTNNGKNSDDRNND